jgi:hypothetical protein
MNRLGSLLCALGLAFASSALARDTAIYDKAAPLVEREKVFDAGSGFLQAFERLSLGPMLQQIPAHGQGLLMASWTPSTNPSNSPTFVIQHGGGYRINAYKNGAGHTARIRCKCLDLR